MDKPILKKAYWLWIVFLVIGASACKTSKPQKANDYISVLPDSTFSDTLTYNTFDNKPVWAAKKGNYNPERNKKSDLLHTKLAVSFDWNKKYLIGTATLTLKPYFYPQSTLELDAKGFEIKSIKMLNLLKPENTKDLKYDYNQKKLFIQLDKNYGKEDKFMLEINYIAKPDELPAGGSLAITSDKGLYFINPDGKEAGKPRQIWTQGETESSSCWFPTIDSPNERCTQEIYITIDKQFKSLSNGELVSSKENQDGTRTDYWKMDKPHAPYLFMMAIGDFAVVKDKWKDKEVSYYVEPAFEKYARNIFGNTPEMIEFFSNKLKYPYPWNKYAQVVVRDFVSGAMENTTASVFYDLLQVDDRSLLDEHHDGIIAHELFHQWFGDLLTCESWANLPLNESFANYSEYLWAEYKYGRDEADYLAQIELQGYLSESENKQEPLIRYYHLDKEEMFDAHSYNKGGRIMHMLRKYLGDEAFWEALHQYLKKYEYKDVEIHDLRLVFEEVCGEDLSWFFNQWFMSAGHPHLIVNHNFENAKVKLSVNQIQDSLYTPIYRLPLQVAIWTNGQKLIHSIEVNRATQEFEFPAEAQPDLLLFDEEQQLLGIIEHSKSEAELIFQYYHSDKFLYRLEALMQLTDISKPTIRKMYLDALQDKFWVIRQTAAKTFEAYQEDEAKLIKEKIAKMAQDDKKSAVRASAIDVLASFTNNADYKSIFLKGMEDKSYSVLASSLYAYALTGATDVQAKMTQFEKINNLDVISLIAEYYAETANPDKYEWMAKQVKETSGFDFQLFANYLANSNTSIQKQGIQLLESIAKGDKYWFKFSAYRALHILKDVEGVKALMDKLKSSESDKNLIELYKMVDNS